MASPLPRSVWIFLIAGLALRLIALNQPLIDAHLIRQTQTASATRSLIETPGFHISTQAPWMGDIDAPYILELPLYNYLVMGVNQLVRPLDMSGKLTTIALWALSFLLLQRIWRRFLDSGEAFWANLLFVVAPLGLFYGQAFMPEMLVQLLAFGFVLSTLRYSEKPSLTRWSLCVGLGMLGLLVKLPEIAHLYIILAYLIFRRESGKALLRPRYILGAVLTICALKGWSMCVDSINAPHFPEFRPAEVARYLVGPLENRMHLKPWASACLYVVGFILPGTSLLAALYGARAYLRDNRDRFLGVWLGSVVVAYLVWFGTGPTAQSYYNLPALAPLCCLFGIGMRGILAMRLGRSQPRLVAVTAAVLTIFSALPVWRYLFKQDHRIFAAAQWAAQNTDPNDITLFRLNHRPDMAIYPYNTVPAYYSGRRVFVWTNNMPETVANQALRHARYAVVTSPESAATGIVATLNHLRHIAPPAPESSEWLEKSGFRLVTTTTNFVVYRRD